MRIEGHFEHFATLRNEVPANAKTCFVSKLHPRPDNQTASGVRAPPEIGSGGANASLHNGQEGVKKRAALRVLQYTFPTTAGELRVKLDYSDVK